jgi:hypothetical protein
MPVPARDAKVLTFLARAAFFRILRVFRVGWRDPAWRAAVPAFEPKGST